MNILAHVFLWTEVASFLSHKFLHEKLLGHATDRSLTLGDTARRSRCGAAVLHSPPP